MCTANVVESIFPGGEVEFVRHLISDSLRFKNRVRWDYCFAKALGCSPCCLNVSLFVYISTVLFNSFRVFTTMLGKKTSVSILKQDLKRNQVRYFPNSFFLH